MTRLLLAAVLPLSLASCAMHRGMVEIRDLDCPAELASGESGHFRVVLARGSTPDHSVTWSWGDGTLTTGAATTSQAYRSRDVYTVEVLVATDQMETVERCVVAVAGPVSPPRITRCRVTPGAAASGDLITFSATINSDAGGPITASIDWGDGTVTDSLRSTHRYATGGAYTIEAIARSPYGASSCTRQVTIRGGPTDAAGARGLRLGLGRLVLHHLALVVALPAALRELI